MITRFLIFLLLALPAFCQNTARYPTTITTMQDLAFARDAPNKSQLTSSINNVTLTATVADGTLFRPFNLLTFSDTGEQVMVCTVLVNDLQLCGRGFAGTSPTFHSSGVILSGNVTAWHHNQLAAEVIAVQSALGTNLSNIPTPSWTTLSGRPTALSQFTNDSGFLSAAALNTWTGSANITSVGTLTSGTIPWSLLTGAPTGTSPWFINGSKIYYTGGNVGIGTGLTNPTSTLQVTGTFSTTTTVPGATAVTANQYGTTGSNVGLWATASGSSSSNTAILASASGAGSNIGVRIVFPSKGTNNYALDSESDADSYFAGKVGIGGYPTTSASPLQVIGLVAYASNASAKTAGLTTGSFYRTTADPSLVAVVY